MRPAGRVYPVEHGDGRFFEQDGQALEIVATNTIASAGHK
jgi:hypothetical protein